MAGCFTCTGQGRGSVGRTVDFFNRLYSCTTQENVFPTKSTGWNHLHLPLITGM